MSTKEHPLFALMKDRNDSQAKDTGDTKVAYRKLDASHLDGWENTMTGFGTSHDKTTYAKFQLGVNTYLSPALLSAIYEQDDIAQKVIDIFPHHMVREGFTIKTDDPEQGSAIEEAIEEYDFLRHAKEGMSWGRLYGGALTIIGAIDGREVSEPLNENGIESIDFLNTVDRNYIQIHSWDKDPLSPNFGQPEFYKFNLAEGRDSNLIHHSRVLRWRGRQTTELHRRQYYDGWDASVLTSVYEVLRDFASAYRGVSIMLTEANMGMMKIEDFITMITETDHETLQTRMQLVDMAKGIAHSLIVDKNEDYERFSSNFSGIAEILDRYMMRVASAARAPVTLLFGRSPAGMNATGDSDIRGFYDEISAAQPKELSPYVKRFVKLLMLSKQGPTKGKLPDNWAINYKSLWQQSPGEEATEYKARAEADNIYLTNEVVTPEEIAKSRFTDRGYGRDITIDQDLRNEASDDDVKDLLNKQPTEPPETDDKFEEQAKGELVFAPTTIEVFTTVNEARSKSGLSPWPIEEEGKMTVFAFRSLVKSRSEKVGEAEGQEQAKEKDIAPEVGEDKR